MSDPKLEFPEVVGKFVAELSVYEDAESGKEVLVRFELTATAHSRMQVILKPSDYDRWLDRTDAVRPPVDLLRPYEAAEMTAHEVDPRVGNVRNDEPSLCNIWQCPPNSQ